jgi:hypothetical protein
MCKYRKSFDAMSSSDHFLVLARALRQLEISAKIKGAVMLSCESGT